MPYSDRLDPDHVELYTYADLDALFELMGYLRQVNPRNQFAIKLASDMDRAALYTHLILLGGVDWNELIDEVLGRLHAGQGQIGAALRAARARLDGDITPALCVDYVQAWLTDRKLWQDNVRTWQDLARRRGRLYTLVEALGEFGLHVHAHGTF